MLLNFHGNNLLRLWSIHPKYLDSKGLVALWREGLLAQKVLQGETRGYRHHPQLKRFQESASPLKFIASYLHEVFLEATRRGYSFDASKILPERTKKKIPVTLGQITFETEHLSRKLWQRDRSVYRLLAEVTSPDTHPLFLVKAGLVEDWEVSIF